MLEFAIIDIFSKYHKDPQALDIKRKINLHDEMQILERYVLQSDCDDIKNQIKAFNEETIKKLLFVGFVLESKVLYKVIYNNLEDESLSFLKKVSIRGLIKRRHEIKISKISLFNYLRENKIANLDYLHNKIGIIKNINSYNISVYIEELKELDLSLQKIYTNDIAKYWFSNPHTNLFYKMDKLDNLEIKKIKADILINLSEHIVKNKKSIYKKIKVDDKDVKRKLLELKELIEMIFFIKRKDELKINYEFELVQLYLILSLKNKINECNIPTKISFIPLLYLAENKFNNALLNKKNIKLNYQENENLNDKILVIEYLIKNNAYISSLNNYLISNLKDKKKIMNQLLFFINKEITAYPTGKLSNKILDFFSIEDHYILKDLDKSFLYSIFGNIELLSKSLNDDFKLTEESLKIIKMNQII